MSSSDDVDDGLSAPFARLFSAFAAAPGAAVDEARTAFVLGRLQAPPGARIACCDRALVAYGWALTGRGYAICLASAASDPEPLDGALLVIDRLEPRDIGELQRVGNTIRPGRHLVVEVRNASVDICKIPGFACIEDACSPGGDRLLVRRREPL